MFTYQTTRSIAKALVTKKNPYYIQFYINGRCNLKCRQCNIVETNSHVPEMTLDQIRAVAKNLRQTGVGIVLLTGGEPFMRNDLPEIVEIFVKEKMNVRCQTAGTHYATEEKLQAVYDAGARDINVSLDSLDFLTSDYINAVPGSGKNAVETIERISRIFREKSAILSFGTVLSRLNYREIPSIIEFARRIGWFVSLVPVHISSVGVYKAFRSYEPLFLFRNDQHKELDRLKQELISIKRQGAPFFDSESFICSAISFLKGNGPTWRHNGVCDSPNLYFAVRPDGAFTTCCDYTLTNPPYLYDNDFKQKYKSGKIRTREDVQKIVKNCAGCHYGSYPEVTLSVRNLRALFERIRLVTTSGKGQLKKAEVKDHFVATIKKIQNEYPEIYPVENWLDDDIKKQLSLWNNHQSRIELIRLDNEIRKQQGRVRGTPKTCNSNEKEK